MKESSIIALVQRLLHMLKSGPGSGDKSGSGSSSKSGSGSGNGSISGHNNIKKSQQLTERQMVLVKSSGPILRSHGEEITSLFYSNLLQDHPELHNMFNEANLSTGRLPRALVSVILTFASNPEDFTELRQRLERVCNKHCSLGVRPEQYDLVGEYLLRAFAMVLGNDWTSELHETWAKAYGMLARILIGREERLYKDFGSWRSWRWFTIEGKIAEADDFYSFYLVPSDGKPLPKFVPGQYISVMIDVPSIGFLQARQYSLSEAPRDDFYRISVGRDRGIQTHRGIESFKLKPGLVSNLLLDRFEVGDHVSVSHPSGGFQFEEEVSSKKGTETNPLVFVSAGSGATPLMSMLNTAAEKSETRPLSWIHCSTHSPAFQDHIQGMAARRENFSMFFFRNQLADIDYRRGTARGEGLRLNMQKIERRQLHLDDERADYYICGPEAFTLDMSRFLREQGVAMGRLHHEWFSTGDLEIK